MIKTGASYQPELIELMKTALDEAANTLPVARQTSAMTVRLASRILSAAALGVRDPIQLRIAALMEIEEVADENDIHRSYAQLQRLRLQVEEAELANSRPETRRAAAMLQPSPIKRAKISHPSGPVCEISGWACEDTPSTSK